MKYINNTALFGIAQKPDLQPHDLRRTYAELGRRAGQNESWTREHALIFQRYLCFQVSVLTRVPIIDPAPNSWSAPPLTCPACFSCWLV